MSPKELSPSDKSFASAMTTLREARGYSQNQLAAALNRAGLKDFYQTTVSRIEKNTRSVRLNEALVIARVLGTTVDEMLTPDALSRNINRFYQDLEGLEIYHEKLQENAIGFETFRLQAIKSLEAYAQASPVERASDTALFFEEDVFTKNVDGRISRLLTQSVYEIILSELEVFTQQFSEPEVKDILTNHTKRADTVLKKLGISLHGGAR